MKLIQPCSLIKKVALSKSLGADKWPSNNMFSENNMKRSSFLIKQSYCLFMNKIGNRGCEIVQSCWSKFDVYEGKICDEFKFCRFCAPNVQIKVGNVFFSEILFQRYSFKLPPQDLFQKCCWNSCIFLMVSLSHSKNIFDGCSLGVFLLDNIFTSQNKSDFERKFAIFFHKSSQFNIDLHNISIFTQKIKHKKILMIEK